MSDASGALTPAPPADLMKRLEATDGQIKSVEIILEQLKNLGRDTSREDRILSAMKESRRLLMEAYTP